MYLLHIYPPPPRYSAWLRVERERTEGCKGNTLPDQVCRTNVMCALCTQLLAPTVYSLPTLPTLPTLHTPYPHPHTPTPTHPAQGSFSPTPPYSSSLYLRGKEGVRERAKSAMGDNLAGRAGQGRENACMACVHACMHGSLTATFPFFFCLLLLPFARFRFCRVLLEPGVEGVGRAGREGGWVGGRVFWIAYSRWSKRPSGRSLASKTN